MVRFYVCYQILIITMYACNDYQFANKGFSFLRSTESMTVSNLTCKTQPIMGSCTVLPAFGKGHWSISWQLASKAGLSISKKAGATILTFKKQKIVYEKEVWKCVVTNRKCSLEQEHITVLNYFSLLRPVVTTRGTGRKEWGR